MKSIIALITGIFAVSFGVGYYATTTKTTRANDWSLITSFATKRFTTIASYFSGLFDGRGTVVIPDDSSITGA